METWVFYTHKHRICIRVLKGRQALLGWIFSWSLRYSFVDPHFELLVTKSLLEQDFILLSLNFQRFIIFWYDKWDRFFLIWLLFIIEWIKETEALPRRWHYIHNSFINVLSRSLASVIDPFNISLCLVHQIYVTAANSFQF